MKIKNKIQDMCEVTCYDPEKIDRLYGGSGSACLYQS
ncbi:hypothetical protein SAMN05216352_1475 [Alteribacillus bidgolensis]|uniref:Uncharacterized protein n=1 Tax=Alteribacillus bidgolensis TaxID=930129 RepID=A0A1G8S971_9BACI|nr:hypothetical protein SAMN05216352_1475 [Alteribacillus bidgolensis]